MYSVFLELLRQRNLRVSDVAKITGISNATFSDWKKGKYIPKADKMKILADFFGVPVEFLMTGEHPAASSLDSVRQNLITAFDELNSDGQDALMSYVDFLLTQEKFKKKNTKLIPFRRVT